MSTERMDKTEGRARAVRRLWYAAGCFALTLVIYYASGGTGRFSLLVGALSAFISLAMLIFLVAGIYGLIKYR
ncbi:MAG: hypothetical protein WD751_00025 [Anaerolineales bacterium]